MSSIAEAIALTTPSFTGQLLRPTDDGYDDVRRVHNGLIDMRPAAIARCHGVADVVDVVQLAHTLGHEVAVRGGGHNVAGRATIDGGLMIDLSPMKGIHVAHPLPRALDVLRFYRDTCASLPDEAMLVAALQTAPDGSNAKLVGIVGGHCGPLVKGEAAFRSLKAFGPPVMDVLGPMPYTALNGMLDPAFPRGALSYWKAQFLTDLSDDAIRALIAGFERCPSPMSHIIIEHFHGAASRVPVTATACTMRVTGFNVIIASQWMASGETEQGIKWARETFASLTPYLAPTRYVNYLEHDARDAASVVYGPNLPRLRAIKTKYDPGNFFRHNVNILPE